MKAGNSPNSPGDVNDERRMILIGLMNAVMEFCQLSHHISKQKADGNSQRMRIEALYVSTMLASS